MTRSIPFVVIVSDGVAIRTLHEPAFGEDAAAMKAIVSRAVFGKPTVTSRVTNDVTRDAPPAPETAHPDTMIQREIGQTQGFSGNACTTCGSFAMRRDGKCERCDNCGSTSGGCA